ncbi:MAG: peptide ABC transporter substrate-binding protein [Chlamydiales bacterium]
MRKFLFIFPLLLLCFSCSKKQERNSMEQTLRLNIVDDPASLDPGVVRSIRDITIVKHLFEGLMRADFEGNPKPALAQSVDISEDLLTYTFKLRKAYWNNGDQITAQDFVYAWRKVLDPSSPSDYAYLLHPINKAEQARKGECPLDEIGAKALDDETLVVQLKVPTPYFLDLAAFPTFFPLNHKTGLESDGKRITNGPFQLKEWTYKSALYLEKNPTYWDANAVHLKTIAFSIINDNLTESHLFTKKELDWLGQPLSHNIATEIIGQSKELSGYPIAGTLWFSFNTEKEPFNEPRLRRAFSYAINREDIIKHILQGSQSVATGPVPLFMALKQTPYFKDGDRERSKALFEEVLAEKGCTLENFPKICLNYPPSERNNKIAQLVQQQWRETLGVNVELAPFETQTYLSKVKKGSYQIGIGQWIADFNDPIAFLELFKYRNDAQTGSGMNDAAWQNETYISLLDESMVEKDPKRRHELLKKAEAILVSEMPIAPVYHYAFEYLKQPYVKNVILSPTGTIDLKYAYKE